MLRNLLCFIVGVIVAAIAFPFLFARSPANVWLAIGLAVLIGVGAAVVFGYGWWRVERHGGARFVRFAIEVVLIVLVAFTCLALGGTPAWTWVITEVLAGVALILWAVRIIIERRIVWVKTPLNLILVLLVLYIFCQLPPVPASLLKVFQPNALRVRVVGPPTLASVAAQPLNAEDSYPLSVNRAQTRNHLYLLAAYVVFFLVFVNNITDRYQLGRMLAVVLLCAAVTAVTGLATLRQDERLLYRRFPVAGEKENSPILNSGVSREFSAGYGYMLQAREGDEIDFYVSHVQTGDVFGGFPSSNSAATVLAMGLILALGVLFAYVGTWRSEWHSSGGLLFTREGNITLLLAFVCIAAAAGLVMTKSRGAVGVAVFMVPVLLLLVAFSRSWLAVVVTLGVILLLVIVPIIALGAGEVRQSLGDTVGAFLNPFGEDVRLQGRESAWRIIGDFPLFGTGLGTFADAFPVYKIHGPNLYFAHCDVLQWWAETGLVGLALAGAALGVAAWTVVTGYRRLKDRFARRLLIAVSLAATVFLLHGLVDFPMAIPGVAIVFVALLGAAVVIARDRITRHEEEDLIL